MDVEVEANEKDIERMLTIHFSNIQSCFKHIEIIMETWTDACVRDDIVRVRRDVSDLEKVCKELIKDECVDNCNSNIATDKHTDNVEHSE